VIGVANSDDPAIQCHLLSFSDLVAFETSLAARLWATKKRFYNLIVMVGGFVMVN